MKSKEIGERILRKPIVSSDVYSKPPEDNKLVCLSCGGSGKKSIFFRGSWIQWECTKCSGKGTVCV